MPINICELKLSMHELVPPAIASVVAFFVWLGSVTWWEPVPGERWNTHLLANSTLHSFSTLDASVWDEYGLLTVGGLAVKAFVMIAAGTRKRSAFFIVFETALYAWTLATCANLWAQEPRPTYNDAAQPIEGDMLMSYASRHATFAACVAVFGTLIASSHETLHPIAWTPLVWSLAVVVQRSTHRKHHPWSALMGWVIGAVAATWAFSRYQQMSQHDTRSGSTARQQGAPISGMGFGVRRNGEMEILTKHCLLRSKSLQLALYSVHRLLLLRGSRVGALHSQVGNVVDKTPVVVGDHFLDSIRKVGHVHNRALKLIDC